MRTVITSIAHNVEEVSAHGRYLHRLVEDQRIALARELHDDMGDLLVCAAMDLRWTQAHEMDAQCTTHMGRLASSLDSAIHLKRDLIERLRPTLLDTMGLFEALRWYFKHACRRDGAHCSESMPSEEIPFTALSLSNTFRLIQSLLDCVFAEGVLRTVDLNIHRERESLLIRLAHSHSDHEITDVQGRFKYELVSAAHRAADLGGELSFEHIPRGLVYHLTVPLSPTVISA